MYFMETTKPMSGVKVPFVVFFLTWQVKTVRYAKRPHCWKKKTNNKKKAIQLLGKNMEDEKKGKIQGNPEGHITDF